MANYKYKARDNKGRAINGKMDAASMGAAVDYLRKQGYVVVSVKPESPAFSFQFSIPLTMFIKIKLEDLIMCTNQLSAMLGSGIPLSTAIDILADQTENARLKEAIQKVSADIKGGTSFANALLKYPDIFPQLFVNMVAAGEVAGNLDEVLLRVAVFFEKQAQFSQKVISALFYPVILLVFSVVVIVVVVLTVLPSFVSIYKDAGVRLPLPTLILYNLNLFIRAWWPLILSVIAAMVLIFRFMRIGKRIKPIMDRIMLDLPVLGKLTRKVEIARISRTLASLLSSGIPMLQALDTLEKTTGNAIYSGVIKEARDKVGKGGALAEQFRISGEFPPMPVKMIAVGEEAGSLDKMLSKVADFYESAVDYSLERLTAMVEPIFLVLIGGIVGMIMASVILPIFRMVETIRR